MKVRKCIRRFTAIALAGDAEEQLEDPIPLRNLKRPDGKRAQVFLRYRDDPEKAVVKVYGGWLR